MTVQVNGCTLCGNSSFFNLFRQNIDFSEPWSLFIQETDFPFNIEGKICLSCGWIFQNPTYSVDELYSLYNFKEDCTSLEAIQHGDKNAAYRSRRIHEYVKPWLLDKSTILDVGGRNGELMEAFLQFGCEVSVLDMDAGEPIDARIKKIRAPFVDWSLEKYDLITMSHVLEHVASPKDFLFHAYNLLNDNGLIFVEVPSELLTCMIKRHAGDHRHLCYFTKQTLKSHLYLAGFDCLTCDLVLDVVGGRIPLLRAVGRKNASVTRSTNSVIGNYAVFKSILEVLHPKPWLNRIFK